jgi:prefoldin subunit 5
MSDDINRRLDDIESNLNKLHTKVALLDQAISNLTRQEEKQQQTKERVFLFVVGGFISAIVAWVVRGGLGS